MAGRSQRVKLRLHQNHEGGSRISGRISGSGNLGGQLVVFTI